MRNINLSKNFKFKIGRGGRKGRKVASKSKHAAKLESIKFAAAEQKLFQVLATHMRKNFGAV